MATLKQKSINGMIWTVGERLSMQLVQLVISIVLARLLNPTVFGLISMLSIFTAIAQSILDSGFGSALIQKNNVDIKDTSSVFFFNLFIGIFLASVLYFSAPLIAKFYNQSILIPITRVMSLNLIINSFSLVQTAMLTKELDFKTQLKVGLASSVASGAIGIILAYSGFGIWSLVIQHLASISYF